jgi:hypothetical protein
MTRNPGAKGYSAVFAVAALAGLAACDAMPGSAAYQRDFAIAQCALTHTGRNDYMILEPGYQAVLEGDGTRLQITVLDETKLVDGVVTRVVEEREWSGGQLSEVARNFFAICPATKDIYYFGEDVDFYKDGKVTGHAGTWLAGKDGARAGLIMPGQPRAGMKYYQEVAPGVAMDRAEVLGFDAACKTPAGTFANCLRTKEIAALDFWSALMFWDAEEKIYAPGIGLVRDGDLLLTRRGMASKS